MAWAAACIISSGTGARGPRQVAQADHLGLGALVKDGKADAVQRDIVARGANEARRRRGAGAKQQQGNQAQDLHGPSMAANP